MPRVDPVVVVPAYKQHDSRFDQVSIAHLRRYLGRYRTVVIKPQGLDWCIPGVESICLPAHNFANRLSYNRLLLSTDFYSTFEDHSHILIYQFDALVLRDELREWCAEDYDYIGASWYPELISQYEGLSWPYARNGCGNGGFSLRRVSSFLRHLRERPDTMGALIDNAAHGHLRRARLLWRYRAYLTPGAFIEHETLNEDVYYGVFAPFIKPTLTVPPASLGDYFSFEHGPQTLYRRTGRIPFGCHAWYKFDDSLRFWSPYLLPAA